MSFIYVYGQLSPIKNLLLFIHSGERPFKCDVWDNCFPQYGILIIHLRIHNGDCIVICLYRF